MPSRKPTLGVCSDCPFKRDGNPWPKDEGETFMRTMLNPESFGCHMLGSPNSDCLGSKAREAGKLHLYEDTWDSDAEVLRHHLQSFTEAEREGIHMTSAEILQEAARDNERWKRKRE